jgi:hypothetical protein
MELPCAYVEWRKCRNPKKVCGLCCLVDDEQRLTTSCRYSDFVTLRERLIVAFPRSAASMPQLPPKSLICKSGRFRKAVDSPFVSQISNQVFGTAAIRVAIFPQVSKTRSYAVKRPCLTWKQLYSTQSRVFECPGTQTVLIRVMKLASLCAATKLKLSPYDVYIQL